MLTIVPVNVLHPNNTFASSSHICHMAFTTGYLKIKILYNINCKVGDACKFPHTVLRLPASPPKHSWTRICVLHQVALPYHNNTYYSSDIHQHCNRINITNPDNPLTQSNPVFDPLND